MIRFVAWLFVATALRQCWASDYKPPITYAGPIVYTDEKPPIISFPGPPAHGYKGGNDNYGYGDSKGPNSITYVPLPLDDLPILIYQSKDKPPIHLINRPSKDSSYGAAASNYGSATSAYNSQNYVGGGSSAGGYKSESQVYGSSAEAYGNTGGYGGSSSTSDYGSGAGSYGSGSNYGAPAPAPASYSAPPPPPPPPPKPVYVPKPSTPSAVYLPQVKPQYSSSGYDSGSSYGMNSGGYGASGYYNNVDVGGNSYASGSGYGGSMSYNNGGGYSSTTSSTSTYGSGTSYNPPPPPPPPPPPHIVYSGHPPIHVYQQPAVYNQPQSSYGSGGSGYGGGYGGGKFSAYPQPSGGYGGKPYNQGYGGKPPNYSHKNKMPYAPPKQNYVPAPPGYHKPPIIIYQGIRPPVHVYSEPASSSYDKPSYGSSTGSYDSAGYVGSYESGAPSYAAYSSKNGEEWEPLKRQESKPSNGASFSEKMDTDIEPEETEVLVNETDQDFTTEQESSSAPQ